MAATLDSLAQELEARYSERFSPVGGDFHAKRFSSPGLTRLVWGVGAGLEIEGLYHHIDLDLASRPRFGGPWRAEIELAEARTQFEEEIARWVS